MIPNLNHYKKYFWDGLNNWSDAFVIRRLAEYAPLPDFFTLPFDQTRDFLTTFQLTRLRTGQERIRFFNETTSYLQNAQSWEEALHTMVDDYFEREYGLKPDGKQ